MSDISFEQALQQLEHIVVKLEQGELPLEQALEQYEQAVSLARISQQKLQQAEQKISKLLQQQGQESLVAFQPQEDE
ncbi:MAG: Exodeoxyribonuclease 7 small subunit [Pseudidiomarina mangrovi]|nr:MAG: Exodeoxyribonuclease 7 small subunit [Pseudidiomarina mangrovi]